jgi:hypothetical protein
LSWKDLLHSIPADKRSIPSLSPLVAGIAGTKIQKQAEGKKIGWITALDPNWEHFDDAKDDNRLTKNSAEFVDVIHCNMGKETGRFGTELRLGTADFYPNGINEINYVFNNPRRKQEVLK